MFEYLNIAEKQSEDLLLYIYALNLFFVLVKKKMPVFVYIIKAKCYLIKVLAQRLHSVIGN